MASPSKRREKDFKKLIIADYQVEMINDSMQDFYVQFHGPKDSLYHGGVWRVRVELPDAYPYKSPSIGFVNKIYHPNVDEMYGSVCLDVSNQAWDPMFDLVKVFEVFLPQLLLYPNPSDPLNEEAADLMMRDHNAYEQRVREYCEKYAKAQDRGASSDEKSSNEEPRGGDSRKRKRGSQSFSGMLNWLQHVAKHSDDPTDGHEEFLDQAMFAREALFTRHSSKNPGEQLQQDQQKKQKTHPTMYQDVVLGNQWTEKLRCRNKTTYLMTCHDSYAIPESKAIIHQPEQAQNSKTAPEKPVTINKESPSNLDDHKSTLTQPDKHVLVGPAFQANVPEWTGVISESDSKWLGTRMWPPEHSETKPTTGFDDFSCNCHFPSSVECFRFHIAEKRFKLKQELGALFFRWRFDRMGEEVSLSWTKDEEKIFKDLVRTYVGFPKKFWNNAYRLLPTKKKDDLVSYYFNVYIIQRRSYQNRVTQNDLDSDDDEKECGVIGDGFGYKALHVPGFKPLPCSLNMQSTELV